MDSTYSRINILHTLVHQVDLRETCRFIETCVHRRTPQQIVTANLDFLRISMRDRSFRDTVNTSALVVPDGMPLVWASRLLGNPLPERVAGIDLVMECAHLAAGCGFRVFLLGAAPGVADAAASILQDRYPNLNIVGTHSPPLLDETNDATTLAIVRAARPDILLVAFGAPRQELWIRKHMHSLEVPVCIGVGGSFDMISGRVTRAPKWMQRGGMEWFYRFVLEPKRLWKRYFVQDLPVLVRLIAWSTDPKVHPSIPLAFSHRQALADESAIPVIYGR